MFTLHNGDCLEYMKSMPDKSVDVIITDPPYNERTHQGAVTGQTFGVRKNEIDFAPLLDPEHLVREFLRISKHWCLAFCSVEDFYWRVSLNVTCWGKIQVWKLQENLSIKSLSFSAGFSLHFQPRYMLWGIE